MYISKVNDTTFEAGKVKLNGLVSKDLSVQYEQMKKIADNAGIDVLILKSSPSGAKKDMYSVIAAQDLSVEPYVIHGSSSSFIHKDAAAIDVGAKVLETVVNAVNTLGKKVEKIAGFNPDYLSWMK